jgi:hypothetical protein
MKKTLTILDGRTKGLLRLTKKRSFIIAEITLDGYGFEVPIRIKDLRELIE